MILFKEKHKQKNLHLMSFTTSMWLECVTRVPLTWKTRGTVIKILQKVNVSNLIFCAELYSHSSTQRVEMLIDHKMAAFSLCAEPGTGSLNRLQQMNTIPW